MKELGRRLATLCVLDAALIKQGHIGLLALFFYFKLAVLAVM